MDKERELREIREAIEVGRQLLSSLQRAEDQLSSAAGWGWFDIFGGGFISTMMKHSRMDSAGDEIQHAQRLLKRFRKELADISIRGEELNIDVGGFLTFADYFFDSLVADWLVQSKINESKQKVLALEEDVEEALRRLDRMEDMVQGYSS